MLKTTKQKRKKKNLNQPSNDQCLFIAFGMEPPKPKKPLPNQTSRYEDIRQQRRTHILKYIKMYILRKDIQMKDVLKGIERKLNQTHKLTIKQFKAIDKFLIREPCFVGFTRKTLEDHFEYIIQYPKDHSKYRSPFETDKDRKRSGSIDLSELFS